jgi:DNA helicase-2/ATP-dependent DNA helicase PcrA
VKETVKLLETNNEVRLRNIRKFICVDECQDTDVVQFRLLQLIYGGNIFVVGDENQLIYEWRSAVAGNLSNFTKYFPGSDTLYLGTNYRSTGAIVEFLKRITPVDNGLASRMSSAREYGEKPVFVRFDSDLHEADAILKEIKDPENSVIIARTNRLLRTVQRQALQKGIKTTILGRKNLWQREEVKHLLDLAKAYPNQQRIAYDVLTELQTQHNLVAKYANTGTPNDKPPVENIADFIRLSAKRGDLKTFLAWFNRLRYAKSTAKDPMLTLTTVHQAKGHEWKNVYVIGCKQGTMPHTDGEIMEEKRIFFVACSRAADHLQISYWGNRSQFLNDFIDEIQEGNKDASEGKICGGTTLLPVWARG